MQIVLLGFLSLTTTTAVAKESKKVTHVVMVWLKQPGNEKQRNAFVKASKKLNNLPGIISRHVGVVKSSDRAVVDDTFDVAITVTMENQAALDAYLNNPKQKKILKNEIKPLINRAVVYDFMSE